MKTAIVIGGGIVGASTLYALSKAGIEAHLLEANDELAMQTSFANGAMVTPSMPAPWNAPGIWEQIPTALFNPHSALSIRWKALPSLIGWGLQFLANSSAPKYAAATDAMFQLADYSRQLTSNWSQEVSSRSEVEVRSTGTMKIFEDTAALEAATQANERLAALGLRFKRLTAEETVALEPALRPVVERLAGALYYPDDLTGDARLFSNALADAAMRSGGRLSTGCRVERLLVQDRCVKGVKTSRGEFSADAVIVAAGNASPDLVKPIGLRLPMRPVKGYSITFPISDPSGLPKIAVVDDAMHAAVVPLIGKIRVVGTAEFAGRDDRLSKERLDNLKRLLVRLYPGIMDGLDASQAEPWAGFRPMTSRGVPFVTGTEFEGLYLNTGHGHLGWTMAAGSAEMVVDMLLDRKSAIDRRPYTLDT